MAMLMINSDEFITSAEELEQNTASISEVITKMRKIAEDLASSMNEANIEKFRKSFTEYLDKINKLTYFNQEISDTLRSLGNEYENLINNIEQTLVNETIVSDPLEVDTEI